MSAPQSPWWAGNPQLIDERARATGIGDRTRASLNRPGGNITGLTDMQVEIITVSG